MAKLISKPKMPKFPTIKEAPAPIESVAEETAPEPTADEIRLQNMLRRRRGRQGTIETSFRGVLSDMTENNSAVPTRKTLLGE